jgi:hypothetical protein
MFLHISGYRKGSLQILPPAVIPTITVLDIVLVYRHARHFVSTDSGNDSYPFTIKCILYKTEQKLGERYKCCVFTDNYDSKPRFLPKPWNDPTVTTVILVIRSGSFMIQSSVFCRKRCFVKRFRCFWSFEKSCYGIFMWGVLLVRSKQMIWYGFGLNLYWFWIGFVRDFVT